MIYFVRHLGEKKCEQAKIQILNREEGCASTFIGIGSGFLFIVKSEDWEERVLEYNNKPKKKKNGAKK